MDYHRRRHHASKALRDRIEVPSAPDARARGQFTLVLSNGRRIESDWGFQDDDLARLIQVAEAV